jgi:hypothetical protein
MDSITAEEYNGAEEWLKGGAQREGGTIIS